MALLLGKLLRIFQAYSFKKLIIMALFNQSHIQHKSYLHLLTDSEGLLLSWLT